MGQVPACSRHVYILGSYVHVLLAALASGSGSGSGSGGLEPSAAENDDDKGLTLPFLTALPPRLVLGAGVAGATALAAIVLLSLAAMATVM